MHTLQDKRLDHLTTADRRQGVMLQKRGYTCLMAPCKPVVSTPVTKCEVRIMLQNGCQFIKTALGLNPPPLDGRLGQL